MKIFCWPTSPLCETLVVPLPHFFLKTEHGSGSQDIENTQEIIRACSGRVAPITQEDQPRQGPATPGTQWRTRHGGGQRPSTCAASPPAGCPRQGPPPEGETGRRQGAAPTPLGPKGGAQGPGPAAAAARPPSAASPSPPQGRGQGWGVRGRRLGGWDAPGPPRPGSAGTRCR